jgi:hypothetical protein
MAACGGKSSPSRVCCVGRKRPADRSGLSGWVAGLLKGVPFLTIGQQFLTSVESYDLAASEGAISLGATYRHRRRRRRHQRNRLGRSEGGGEDE